MVSVSSSQTSDLTNVPHSRETFSNNVPREEGYKLVRRSGWMSCSQVLHAALVRPLKDSGVPEIAVTTDASLVEREQLCETRWRLAERESDPDGLEPARANPPQRISFFLGDCWISKVEIPLNYSTFLQRDLEPFVGFEGTRLYLKFVEVGPNFRSRKKSMCSKLRHDLMTTSLWESVASH
jgi:hypothetical protein